MTYVDILGYKYRLLIVPQASMQGDIGKISHTELTLKIAAEIHLEEKVSTLLHEVIHAWVRRLGIEEHENSTLRLEASIYQFLTANGVSLNPLRKLLKEASRD